jgi:uncharacterized glyoxalase superfamily protein PhnB
MSRSVSSQVEVAVDTQTAFRAFTEEMDLWWVRGPVNFYDAARAIARVCEPGAGGRLLEVYADDALEVGRITAWEPGAHLAWDSAVDDVRTEVTFTAAPGGGTLVVVTATIPDGGLDRGGTSYVRVVPPWFGAWCARRDGAPRTATETARLAVAICYPKPATAARWLADAFGLVPTNPLPDSDESSGWIEFHVGNCSLMVFGRSEEDRRGDGDGGGSEGGGGRGGDDGHGGTEVATHVPWIFVDDLDAHYARAVSRGAVIVEGIHQHGYRAYVARDPDGYTWTIAQARPGMR